METATGITRPPDGAPVAHGTVQIELLPLIGKTEADVAATIERALDALRIALTQSITESLS